MVRYVSDNGPVTVGEAARGYGEARGLARTTIQTVLERLRQKGYVSREKTDGVYHYSACVEQRLLLRSLVRDFTERVLGGSVEPLVAYLAQEANVSDKELEELHKLVDSLSDRNEGRRP